MTNERGDFVFVNVPPGTYTIEVTMPAFKTLKRSGVAVSAGEPSRLGALTLEVGGTAETVDVKGEAPVIQAHERRALVHDLDRVGREPADREPQLHALAALAPGVSGTWPTPSGPAAAATPTS